MREIKFRAWHSFGKRMVYGPSGDSVSPSWVLAMCSANEMEPMQYTGLKDKNGKEIYEGDIVNHRRLGNYPFTSGAITIHPTQGVKVGNWPICFDCEIIGNIYENPELVKEVHP